MTASNITTFLMYDGDVPGVLEALRKCDGILLISKPCIEIWFIAHHKTVPESDISSISCIKQLLSLSGWENYKKSFLTFKQQEMLWNNRMIAVENMKKKNFSDKTYSTIHNLITALETEKNKL